jgi:hypothetical protein
VSHDHDHNDLTANGERDPEEQQQLARDLGEALTEMFQEYVKGDVSFDAVVFETFNTVQDLFVIASGDYEIEYDVDGGEHNHEH